MEKLILYPFAVVLQEMQIDAPLLQAETLVVNCSSSESVEPLANLQQERLLRSFVGAILRPDLRERVLQNDSELRQLLPIIILPALGGIIIHEQLAISRDVLQNYAKVKRNRPIGIVPPSHGAPSMVSIPSPRELWHLDSIRVASVRDTLKGTGVRVGVVDTGIEAGCPAFLRSPAAFAAIDARGVIDDKADPNDVASHGTHVCGLIAGEVVGVAPDATLLVVQALDRWCAGWPCSDLARVAVAIDWLLCKGIEILNLSLGEYGYAEGLYEECQRAREEGVLVVAAIGNTTYETTSPGNYDVVVGMGALSRRGEPTLLSSREDDVRGVPKPDLYAPGYALCSTSVNGRYVTGLSGTSYASAIATGFAALLLQRERENSAAPDLAAALHAATEPLGRRFPNASRIRL